MSSTFHQGAFVFTGQGAQWNVMDCELLVYILQIDRVIKIKNQSLGKIAA